MATWEESCPRTREKDLKGFGIRTTGLDSPEKEGKEPEADERAAGACSLLGQQEDGMEEGRGRGTVGRGGR